MTRWTDHNDTERMVMLQQAADAEGLPEYAVEKDWWVTMVLKAIFQTSMAEWIDFVCRCRDGAQDYRKYDLISGKVADDKVFRVVDLYHAGIWDKERALKEIRVYPNYDQTAFITQRAIERLLNYDSYIEV